MLLKFILINNKKGNIHDEDNSFPESFSESIRRVKLRVL